MTSSFTSAYLKRLKKMPAHVQKRAIKSLELLAEDERHPSLHFKEVAPKQSGWSVRVSQDYRSGWSERVSQDYRMVGYREQDVVTWFWIGKHDDYDKLLDRL